MTSPPGALGTCSFLGARSTTRPNSERSLAVANWYSVSYPRSWILVDEITNTCHPQRAHHGKAGLSGGPPSQSAVRPSTGGAIVGQGSTLA